MANWTSALIGGAGLWDQLDRYDDIGNYVESELDTARTNAVEGTKFTPFTVSGVGGRMSTDAAGGVTTQMDAQTQAMSDARGGQANAFYNRASGDMQQNTQDVFEAMRAMQMPGEERSMMGLESRAAAQGRLGISGNNYGGATPEMLAMQQAIGENRNQAAIYAMEQGRAQQAQDASLGAQYQTAQYMPQAQLSNLFNQGLQGAQLNQAGQLAGANYNANLHLGQVQAQVNSEQTRAQLMQGLYQTIGGAATASGFDPVGSIGSKVGDIFSDWWSSL